MFYNSSGPDGASMIPYWYWRIGHFAHTIRYLILQYRPLRHWRYWSILPVFWYLPKPSHLEPPPCLNKFHSTLVIFFLIYCTPQLHQFFSLRLQRYKYHHHFRVKSHYSSWCLQSKWWRYSAAPKARRFFAVHGGGGGINTGTILL